MAGPEEHPSNDPHRMRSTRPATLLVAVLAAMAASWFGIDNFYGSMPRLPWLPPLTLLALALAEGFAALHTKAWIDRRPGARPVAPLAIARYVVLAKASALVGALFGGMYAGMTGWLLVQRAVLVEADRDLPASIAGVVASVALVIAALLLERACRVPRPPQGGDQNGSGRGGAGSGNEPGHNGHDAG